MSGSKDILIANLRAEIAAGRGTEEANADERCVVAQLLDELLPKRIAEAESCGYDNGYRDGLRACDVDVLRERAEKAERERDELRSAHGQSFLRVKVERDAAIERAEKAEANYAFMVERAADQMLDGYRELGARAAAAEERAELAERERDEARAEAWRFESAWREGFVTHEIVDCNLVRYVPHPEASRVDVETMRWVGGGFANGMHVLRVAVLRAELDEALRRRTRAERVGEAVLLLEGDEQPRDLRSRAASAERYGYDSYGALLRAIADALKEADDAE